MKSGRHSTRHPECSEGSSDVSTMLDSGGPYEQAPQDDMPGGLWSGLTVLYQQGYREFLVRWHQPGLLLQSMLFFMMMTLFFPMTLTASALLLKKVGSGLIWIAVLFATLLSAEGLFQRAYEEGVWEQAWVSGESMEWMVVGTWIVHGCGMICMLLVMVLFLGSVYHFSWGEMCGLGLSVLCGLPGLLGIVALAAAFNVGKGQRTTLMALVVLPFTVPVMIFGSAVVGVWEIPGAAAGVLALLSAFSLVCLGGLPFAIAAILKLRFED